MKDLLKTPLIIVSFTFLSGIFFLINSCSKNPFCSAKSSESGLISSRYKFNCMAYEMGRNEKQVVIDSDSAFRQFIKKETDNLKRYNCDTNIISDIDFSMQTLLGLYANGGGCEIGFEKTVTKDETRKLYKYTIKVNECGDCKMAGGGMFWVLVPKLPQDYTVEFEVK